MGNRWYSIVVILFWLVSMTWLFSAKVLPPLRMGERPNLAKLAVEGTPAARVPVAWNLFWEDRPLGWATNETRLRRDGVTELLSHVHVVHFPLKDLAPAWFLSQLGGLGGTGGELDLDTHSTVELMESGKLKGLHTTVQFSTLGDPIVLTGAVKTGGLEITFQLGEFSYTTPPSPLADSMLSDSLSPRSRLPELHVGQTWTEPMYSPFQPPHQPLQILQATVEREETIEWNGEVLITRLVVYRNDAGSERSGANTARGRVWVRRDGAVLKQEALLMGHRLLFVRVPQGQAPASRAADLKDAAMPDTVGPNAKATETDQRRAAPR